MQRHGHETLAVSKCIEAADFDVNTVGTVHVDLRYLLQAVQEGLRNFADRFEAIERFHQADRQQAVAGVSMRTHHDAAAIRLGNGNGVENCRDVMCAFAVDADRCAQGA